MSHIFKFEIRCECNVRSIKLGNRKRTVLLPMDSEFDCINKKVLPIAGHSTWSMYSTLQIENVLAYSWSYLGVIKDEKKSFIFYLFRPRIPGPK